MPLRSCGFIGRLATLVGEQVTATRTRIDCADVRITVVTQRDKSRLLVAIEGHKVTEREFRGAGLLPLNSVATKSA